MIDPKLQKTLDNLATKADYRRILLVHLAGIALGGVMVIIMRSPWGLIATLAWIGGVMAGAWVGRMHEADLQKDHQH